MGKVLVTGGTGFVGRVMIPNLLAKGEHVIALARDTAKAKTLLPDEVEIIEGDIIQTDLGVDKLPPVDKLMHLAAIHHLGENRADEIWETNVGGTANVIQFCEKHAIPHLFFVSTAYCFARNPYEKSKMLCESMVMNSHIPQKTIFKPSIIMPTEAQTYNGHVLQFAGLLARIHKRAETVRQYIEGTLRLPVLQPVFRAPGIPEANLNLVSVKDVAEAMVRIKETGTFWLCHPFPPTVQQVATWVGEAILVDFRIEPQFSAMPLELVFRKMGAAFLPYLWGDNFKSDLSHCSPITRELINSTVRLTLFS